MVRSAQLAVASFATIETIVIPRSVISPAEEIPDGIDDRSWTRIRQRRKYQFLSRKLNMAGIKSLN